METRTKYNNLLLGLMLGLLIPFITASIFYFYYQTSLSYGEFFFRLHGLGIFSALISLCAIPNLIIFFIFIWKNFLYSARGVVFSTLAYAVLVFALKFLL